jgi:hypothetical protein
MYVYYRVLKDTLMRGNALTGSDDFNSLEGLMVEAADITAQIDGLAAALGALPGESGPLDLAKDRIEQVRHFVAAHLAIIEGQQMSAALEAHLAADEAVSPTTAEG